MEINLFVICTKYSFAKNKKPQILALKASNIFFTENLAPSVQAAHYHNKTCLNHQKCRNNNGPRQRGGNPLAHIFLTHQCGADPGRGRGGGSCNGTLLEKTRAKLVNKKFCPALSINPYASIARTHKTSASPPWVRHRLKTANK